MHSKQMTNAELAKSVLLGIAAISVACAGIWVLGFSLGLIK
jgi:hypothetical protein